ncbi:Chromosome-partitioning ATPase Soj [compost metagenome]
MKMCKKIFFGNYKGGVGKTTSTYNIAVEMAKNFGKKVLLIDLDPQSSLSEVCMNSYGGQLDDLGHTPESLNYVYDINMQSKKVGNIKIKLDVKKIIKKTNGVSFIPNTLFYKNGGLDKISMDIGTNVENFERFYRRNIVIGRRRISIRLYIFRLPSKQ